MNYKNSDGNSKDAQNRHPANSGPSSFCSALEVGRILRTFARFGHLDVYARRDGSLGAAFICEENGGRYGVTRGVKERFWDPGRYGGWGYINSAQTAVFKFLLGDGADAPESLVAIETVDGRVDFPEDIKNPAKYPDGSIVAFYARPAKRNQALRPRREAREIFPVDVDHLPLAAGLISAGRLSFPEHSEVLQLFFDSLPNMKGLDQQNRKLFDSALVYLAADASVPPQFQSLARVERCRLSAADGARAVAGRPERPPRHETAQEGGNPKPEVRRSSRGSVVTDVMRVDLEIGRD